MLTTLYAIYPWQNRNANVSLILVIDNVWTEYSAIQPDKSVATEERTELS